MPQPPKKLPADFDFGDGGPPQKLPADFDFGDSATVPGRDAAKAEINALLEDPKPSNTIGEAASAFWERVNPVTVAKGLAELTPRMLMQRAVENIGRPAAERTDVPFVTARAAADQARKSGAEWEAGNPSGAIGHGVAAVLPFVGPAAAEVGEELGRGEYAKGAGHLAGMLAPGPIARGVVRGVNAARRGLFPNQNSPVVERALASAEGKGIPMSAGQRQGLAGVQRVEQNLVNLPGSANKAQAFYNRQQEALAEEAGKLTRRASPVGTDQYGAGMGIKQGVQRHVATLKSAADTLYDDVRSVAASKATPVQTGSVMSSVLGPTGAPVMTPVMTVMEAPVYLDPIRKGLLPLYEELQRTLPVARQQASPAYTVLKDIMENGREAIPAMDFDRALGAIKAITREGSNPYLSNRSQGLARRIVQEGETELANALGPQATKTLAQARAQVKSYYDAAETLADLSDEPGQLYGNLVKGQDRVVDTLKTLGNVAPQELSAVGRTFLQGMFEKVTNEGGFNPSSGIWREWNTLGPRTKDLLFGPKLTPELDNFMLAAKKLTENKNPSGTAFAQTALHGMGTIGSALMAVALGHPEVAASAVGASVAGPAVLANILFKPGVARSLANQMALPSGKAIAAGTIAGTSTESERQRIPFIPFRREIR